MKKRIFFVVLMLALLVTVFAANAFAATTETWFYCDRYFDDAPEGYCDVCWKKNGDFYAKDIPEDAITVGEESAKVVKAKCTELTVVSAKEAECNKKGNLAYAYCSTCNKYWTDAAQTTAYDSWANIELAKLTHDVYTEYNGDRLLTYVEAEDASCTEATNKAYFKCVTCNGLFAENEETWELEQIDAIPQDPAGHKTDIAHRGYEVAGFPASCAEPGQLDYIYCGECRGYYTSAAADADSLVEGGWVIPATGHTGNSYAASPAACVEGGTAAYAWCATCQLYYTDLSVEAECLGNAKELADWLAGPGLLEADGHNLNHVKATAVTHLTDGEKEHWICKDCNLIFLTEDKWAADDDAVAADQLVIPATGHTTLVWVKPTSHCTETGNIGYWRCTVCEKLEGNSGIYGLDENDKAAAAAATECIAKTDVEQDPLGHELYYGPDMPKNGWELPEHIIYAEGDDCLDGGSRAHATCSDCGKQWIMKWGIVNDPWWGEDVGIVGWVEVDEDNTIAKDAEHTMLEDSEVEGVLPTCTTYGNYSYALCEDCGCYYVADSTAPATILNTLYWGAPESTIKPTYHPNAYYQNGLNPTCTEPGFDEHWYCPDCEGYFNADPNGDKNAENLSAETFYNNLAALGHQVNPDYVYPEGYKPAAATHTEDGQAAYIYCERCHGYFGDAFVDADAVELDENGLIVIPSQHKDEVIDELTYKVYHYGAFAETCTENGQKAYIYCQYCDLIAVDNETNTGWYWTVSDKEWIAENDWVIDAIAHKNATKYAAVDATCYTDGNVLYFDCPDCGKLVDAQKPNANVFESLEDTVVKAHTHKNWTAVKYVPVSYATHVEDGAKEHWVCTLCGDMWADKDEATGESSINKNKKVTADDLVIKATGHNASPLYPITEHEAVAATHTTWGNVFYIECEYCKANGYTGFFAGYEADAKEFVPVDYKTVRGFWTYNIKPMGHDRAEKYEALDPTCTTYGHVEYIYCQICDMIDGNTGYYIFGNEYTDDQYAEIEVERMTWMVQYEDLMKGYNKELLDLNPLGHNGKWVDVANATHLTDGMNEHYACEVCGGKFESEAWDAEEAEILVPAYGHTLEAGKHNTVVKIEGWSNHHQEGRLDYYYCAVCDALEGHTGEFLGLEADAIEVDSKNHDARLYPAAIHPGAKYIEAVIATCDRDGMQAYYWCELCQIAFQEDDYSITVIEDLDTLVIPAKNHNKALCNITFVEAIAPTCTEVGYNAYYLCDCGAYLLKGEEGWIVTTRDELRIPMLAHEITEYAAVLPGCVVDGNYAYKYCATCEQYWTDLNWDGEIADDEICTLEETIDYAIGHGRNKDSFAAVKPTCTEPGNFAYMHCVACGTYWTDLNWDGVITDDEICTREETVDAAIGHPDFAIEVFEAVKPSCTEPGNYACRFCNECNTYWTDLNWDGYITNDETCTREETIIVANGHLAMDKIDYLKPTCTEAGNYEYKHCYECGTYWTDLDFDGVIEADETCTRLDVLLVATGHLNMDLYAEKLPTCTEPGNFAFKYCFDCGTYWTDLDWDGVIEANETCEREATIYYAMGHVMNKADAQLPTCTEPGNFEYKYCEVCGAYWVDLDFDGIIEEDEACTREETIILATGHGKNMEAVDAKDPTCLEPGNIAYYFCYGCGKYFADGKGQVEITRESTVVPAINGWAHIDGAWYLYENCLPLTGWQQVDGAWYYMGTDGKMLTGWQYIGGAWYYLNAYGRMQTGWVQVDGAWYYMNVYGRMVYGWQSIGGSWYYFNEYGRMVTGDVFIAGQWYHFNVYGRWEA